ncbi:uncharacterized protein [Drosophila kikkawai]|uniref:Uncharacterized protein n=1 Tax=Drosophila kikkawai TaxID=30033 RepID=A0A6P4I853_DROKI|nr:uncharacterized protein LOC108076676 [Drosophila kikkawai]
MRLSLLLLLVHSWALVATATPAKHWRRAPAHGVFNVDIYAYNKPRMNLARRQVQLQDPPPMGHLLQQIAQHSRRSPEQRSHYRNLDENVDMVMPVAQPEKKTIVDQAINMQLMPLQMNSGPHARENLYSNEFHVQNIGVKKIVQLNTLTIGHEHKPVGEEVMAQSQQEQEQQPLKVKLTLPELGENNAGETEIVPQGDEIVKKDISDLASASASDPAPVPATKAPVIVPAGESLTSVNKTMASSGTIIDMASTGMQQLVSQPTAENAGDTSTKAESGKKKKDETRARLPRPKTRRKPVQTSNETDTKMTASQAVTTPVPIPAPAANPILAPSPGPSNVKQPAKELETQSPEISTHRPLTTKRSRTKTKSKGKGKDKRRQGSQRRPASAGVMEEEIETTTNWWQILPYAEIRKFLNTIYDTIADDVDDDRATDDV